MPCDIIGHQGLNACVHSPLLEVDLKRFNIMYLTANGISGSKFYVIEDSKRVYGNCAVPWQPVAVSVGGAEGYCLTWYCLTSRPQKVKAYSPAFSGSTLCTRFDPTA